MNAANEPCRSNAQGLPYYFARRVSEPAAKGEEPETPEPADNAE